MGEPIRNQKSVEEIEERLQELRCNRTTTVPPTNEDDFKKFDNSKPRTDLIPPNAILEVSRILGFGADKYGESNWAKCPDFNRYIAAALRHIFQYKSGIKMDDESGVSHIAHAVTSLMFVLENDLKKEE